MTDRYDDIINLPHYEPRNHRRMPAEERAAQFASFAALSGHEEAMRDTSERAAAEIEALSAPQPLDD